MLRLGKLRFAATLLIRDLCAGRVDVCDGGVPLLADFFERDDFPLAINAACQNCGWDQVSEILAARLSAAAICQQCGGPVEITAVLDETDSWE